MKRRFPQEFYNVVALLCLLECLFPPFNVQQYHSSFRHSRFKREQQNSKYGGEFSFLESALFRPSVVLHPPKFLYWGSKSNFPFEIEYIAKRATNVNVYIYADLGLSHASPVNGPLRSLEATNFSLNPNGRRNELSLEDIDLIDCLWRQDIDAEKGIFASIQPPENQYESDMLLLSEKHLLQPNRFQLSVVDNQFGSQSQSQQQQDPLKSLEDILLSGGQNEANKYDFIWLNNNQTAKCSEQAKKQLFGGRDKLAFDAIDFLNQEAANDRISLSINDTLKTPTETSDDYFPKNVTLSNNSNDAGFNEFDDPLPNFEFLADANLTDWESAPCSSRGVAASYVDLSAVDSYRPDFSWSQATAMTNELNSLVTPSMEFSSNDLVQLFNDRQVMDDVAEAYQSKISQLPSTSTAAELTYSYSPVSDRSLVIQSTSHLPFVNTTLINRDFLDENFVHSSPIRLDPSLSPLLETSDVKPIDGLARTAFGQNFENDASVLNNYDERNRRSPSSASTEHRDTGNSHGHGSSFVDHDHHYYAYAEDSVVEIEVQSSSPSSNADPSEGKIMPRRISENSAVHYKPLEHMYTASEKDEQLAAKCQLSLSADEIINMPVAEYQRLLKDPKYAAEQKEALRKIRRRGRNKVAAQTCRQRRTNTMQQLETEVNLLEQEYWSLINKKMRLEKQIDAEKGMIRRLKNNVK